MLIVQFVSNAFAVNLQTAVHIAVENSLQIKQYEIELKKANNYLIYSKSKFLPSLDFTSSLNYLGQNSSSGNGNSSESQAELTLSENFYDHGISSVNHEINKINKQIAELNYKRNKSELILNTVKKYLVAADAKMTLNLRRQNLKQIEKNYLLITSHYKQGLRTRQEYLRVESQFQRAKISVTTSELEYENALEDLKTYIGSEENITDITPVTNQDYITSNLENKPSSIYETQKKELLLINSDLLTKKTKKDLFPKLDIVGKVGHGFDNQNNLGTQLNTNQTYWGIYLTLNWNIWDWGALRSNVENTELDKYNQLLSSQFDESNAKEQIRKAELNQRILNQQLLVMENLNKIEKESFLSIEDNYRNGKQSLLDYVTAMTDLLSLQIDKEKIANNLIYENLQLIHLKGYLDETNFK